MMFLQNYETLRLLSSSLSTSFTFQKRAKKRLKTNHADLTFSDVPRPFHYNALSLDKELQRFVRVSFGFSCLLSPLMSILEISFRHWTQFFPCYFLAALKHLCPEMHAMAKNRQPLAIWIGCQKWPLGGWRFWRIGDFVENHQRVGDIQNVAMCLPLLWDEVGPEICKIYTYANETNVHNYNVLMLPYAVEMHEICN